ncbi:hypothetical protein [Litoribacillus peritrichatus]|uniref:Uncharacterized protein n=1 Tax=Litoribacillus peritrichatus TaxID=718191 RepID=A0ABP7MCN6_9GAMM
MPFLLIVSFLTGVALTWFIMNRKFNQTLKATLSDVTSEMSDHIKGLESDLKESSQKVADLEYTLQESKKDLAALKNSRND